MFVNAFLLPQNGTVYVPIIRIYVRMHLPSFDIKSREYHFNQPKFIVSTLVFVQ